MQYVRMVDHWDPQQVLAVVTTSSRYEVKDEGFTVVSLVYW